MPGVPLMDGWIAAQVNELTEEFENSKHEWLLGLTAHCIFEGLWRWAARRVLLEPPTPHPHEADASLRRLGALVAKA